MATEALYDNDALERDYPKLGEKILVRFKLLEKDKFLAASLQDKAIVATQPTFLAAL